jgi:hypothetical protein
VSLSRNGVQWVVLDGRANQEEVMVWCVVIGFDSDCEGDNG